MNLSDYKKLIQIRELMDIDLTKAKQLLTNLIKDFETLLEVLKHE